MQQEDENQIEEPSFEEQYIAVLLEYYCVKEEAEGPSRMEQAKVEYWKGAVSAFERERFAGVRDRLLYRVRKSEKYALGPVGLALSRYAWASFLTESEGSGDVLQRWKDYFSDGIDLGREKLIPAQVFEQQRHLVNAVRTVRDFGLWPWE